MRSAPRKFSKRFVEIDANSGRDDDLNPLRPPPIERSDISRGTQAKAGMLSRRFKEGVVPMANHMRTAAMIAGLVLVMCTTLITVTNVSPSWASGGSGSPPAPFQPAPHILIEQSARSWKYKSEAGYRSTVSAPHLERHSGACRRDERFVTESSDDVRGPDGNRPAAKNGRQRSRCPAARPRSPVHLRRCTAVGKSSRSRPPLTRSLGSY